MAIRTVKIGSKQRNEDVGLAAVVHFLKEISENCFQRLSIFWNSGAEYRKTPRSGDIVEFQEPAIISPYLVGLVSACLRSDTVAGPPYRPATSNTTVLSFGRSRQKVAILRLLNTICKLQLPFPQHFRW